MYGVVGSQSRKIKKVYGAIGSVTKKIKKVYGVVGGVTRLIFTESAVLPAVWTGMILLSSNENPYSSGYYLKYANRTKGTMVFGSIIDGWSGYYLNGTCYGRGYGVSVSGEYFGAICSDIYVFKKNGTNFKLIFKVTQKRILELAGIPNSYGSMLTIDFSQDGSIIYITGGANPGQKYLYIFKNVDGVTYIEPIFVRSIAIDTPANTPSSSVTTDSQFEFDRARKYCASSTRIQFYSGSNTLPEYIFSIYMMNADNTLTTLYSNRASYNNNFGGSNVAHIDQWGRYVVLGKLTYMTDSYGSLWEELFYINNGTVTNTGCTLANGYRFYSTHKIFTTVDGEYLYVSFDSGSGGISEVVYSYKVDGATFTYLGKASGFMIHDILNSDTHAIVCVYQYNAGTVQYTATLSKDSTGCITNYSTISSTTISGIINIVDYDL